MKKLIAIFLGAFLTTGLLTISPAAAHTPDISATCSGVVLKASSYDANKNNKWSVTIDGKTQSGNFGASLDKTFNVPQDGATTEWSASIQSWDKNPAYGQEKSGKVGPCGDLPDNTDTKKVELCHVTSSKTNPYNKITVSVNAFLNSGHIDHDGDIYNAFSYTKKGKQIDVPAKGDTSLLQYNDCAKPVVVDHDWKYNVTCEAVSGSRPNTDSVDSNIRIKNLTTGEVRTFNYHGPDNGPSGPFSYSLKNDYKVPASWTNFEIQWVQVNGTNYHFEGSVICGKPDEPVKPPEPEPIVVVKDKKAVDCTTKITTVTTTTTTTGWKYDKDTNTWVQTEPVVTEDVKTRPATDKELKNNNCTPPVVTPPQPEPFVVISTDQFVDCDTKTVEVITTTTTTPYVYDVTLKDWVLGEPVTDEDIATRPATAEELALEECDTDTEEPPVTPPTVTPPTDQPPATDTPKPVEPRRDIGTPLTLDAPQTYTPSSNGSTSVLPSTGGFAKGLLYGGIALIVVGAVVVYLMRRRKI